MTAPDELAARLKAADDKWNRNENVELDLFEIAEAAIAALAALARGAAPAAQPVAWRIPPIDGGDYLFSSTNVGNRQHWQPLYAAPPPAEPQAAPAPAATIVTFLDPSNNEEECWRVQIDGLVLGATWNSKGAAQAGAEVEVRRLQKAKSLFAPAAADRADHVAARRGEPGEKR